MGDRRLATIRAASLIALGKVNTARRKLRRVRKPSAVVQWTMTAERWESLAAVLGAADDGF